jgi:hypothetical protein
MQTTEISGRAVSLKQHPLATSLQNLTPRLNVIAAGAHWELDHTVYVG